MSDPPAERAASNFPRRGLGLSAAQWDALRAIAEYESIPMNSLVRMWIARDIREFKKDHPDFASESE